MRETNFWMKEGENKLSMEYGYRLGREREVNRFIKWLDSAGQ